MRLNFNARETCHAREIESPSRGGGKLIVKLFQLMGSENPEQDHYNAFLGQCEGETLATASLTARGL
jgi:hypothetical protein